MNILSTVLEVISDNIFLLTSILFIDMVTEKNNYNHSICKKRTVIAIIISSMISILFKNHYIFDHMLFLNGALIVINFFKYIFLISYVHHSVSIRSVLIIPITQFIGSVITSALPMFIPYEENYYIILTVCTLIVNVLLLISVLLIRKKIDHYTIYTIFKLIPAYIYILILIALIILSGITNLLNHETSNYELKITIIKFLI